MIFLVVMNLLGLTYKCFQNAINLKFASTVAVLLLFGIGVKAQIYEGEPINDNRCDEPIERTDCQFIRNSYLGIVSQGATTIDGFQLGSVPGWMASHGTPDIDLGTTFMSPPPSPANFAVLNCGSGQDEGIVCRIPELRQGSEYGFSFFRSTGSPTPSGIYDNPENVLLKIVLLKCEDIPQIGGSQEQFTVPDYSNIDHQVVYCGDLFMGGYNFDLDWDRFFFRFEAEDDFNAIWIFPERQDPSVPNTLNHVRIAVPELIEINQPIQIFPIIGTCTATITPPLGFCGIWNSSLYWVDPYNNIFPYSGLPFDIDLTAPGIYKLFMGVTVSEMDNPCSENVNSVLLAYFIIPLSDASCTCPTDLEFTKGELGSLHKDDGITSDDYVVYDLLSMQDAQCSVSLCHFVDEGILDLDFSSNQLNGNIWEIYRDGVLVPNNEVWTSATPSSLTGKNLIETLVFIDFNEPTIFEIRLKNTILRETKRIFFTMSPQALLGDGTCSPTTIPSGWNDALDAQIFVWYPQFVNSNTQYNWDLTNAPFGFRYNLVPNSPNIIYDPTTVGTGFHAPVTTVNSVYGCEGRRYYYFSPNPYQCGLWKTQSDVKDFSMGPSDNVISEEISIYPNPVQSLLFIKTSKEINRISIYLNNGILVKQFFKWNLGSSINIADLKPGVYIINAHFSDNTVSSKTILKQ